MCVLSYKLAPFCGAGVEVKQNLGGCISSERAEMCILSNILGSDEKLMRSQGET